MKNNTVPQFELVFAVKNKSGNPTGIKKYYNFESAEDLGNFWDRNDGQFWDESKTDGPFLLEEVPPTIRSKTKKSTNSGKDILISKIYKLQKNISKNNSNQKSSGSITNTTIDCAVEIVKSIADLLRVKVKVIATNFGAIQLEFNSYTVGEQALEITIHENEMSYNFWNGIVADQEYSDYTRIDRVKIRQLVEKFNLGLVR